MPGRSSLSAFMPRTPLVQSFYNAARGERTKPINVILLRPKLTEKLRLALRKIAGPPVSRGRRGFLLVDSLFHFTPGVVEQIEEVLGLEKESESTTKFLSDLAHELYIAVKGGLGEDDWGRLSVVPQGLLMEFGVEATEHKPITRRRAKPIGGHGLM